MRRHRGSNAVEFALTLPLLLIVVGGVIDYSFWMFQHQIVVQAAREGARVGALNEQTDDEITIETACTTAATTALVEMGITGTTPTCDLNNTTLASGDEAVVCSIDHTYSVLVGYGVTPPTSITATSVMRIFQ